MTDINDGILDSFLNWLLGLNNEEKEQLSPALKKYKEYLTGTSGIAQEVMKKGIQELINTDPQTRDMMSEYMKELGADKESMKTVEELSSEFGKHFLTGYRFGNAFGNVTKDVAALKDAVEKYAKKQAALKAKGDASMNKIVAIEEALYKADKLKKLIDEIKGNDDEQSKAQKKELERLRDKTIRDAAKLRSINRPASLVRDIERELRNTLSREKRAYNALTGQEIEIYEKDGKPTARSVNVVEKLGGVIERVDIIDDLLKNPTNLTNYASFTEKQKEVLKNYLNNPGDPESGLKKDLEESLKKKRSELIQGAKHMRSHDHRGLLHENGILQELKWTHNRNVKKLSVESQELAAAKKEIDRYNQRIKRAAATLEQRKQGKENTQVFLKGLGGIDTTALRPTVSLPTKKQSTQECQR